MRVSTRLLLIIAACLVPTAGLQFILAWTEWTDRKAQVGDLAIQQAHLLAGNVAGISEGARILLAAAAQFGQVRRQDTQCNARLTGLRQGASGYAFVALVDAAGRVACASDPDLLDTGEAQPWIRGARAATSFTAGRYTVTPQFPGGVLPFYLPVELAAGAARGTLVAALDLSWLEQQLHRLKRAGSSFLAGGVLTVADADGVVLARDARHADFVGRSFHPQPCPWCGPPRPACCG